MPLRIIALVFLLLMVFCDSSRADDCGLRGYDGTAIIKFNCETSEPPTSQLRVTTPTGATRGITLVEETNPSASKFRVRLNDGTIKAIGYITPGSISSCEELQMIGYHPSYPLDRDYTLGDNINCSATNPDLDPDTKVPRNPQYIGSLWQLGYNVYYEGKGFDGNAETTNDNSLTALDAAELGTKGFKPIGEYSKPFTGSLDGRRNIIIGLFINRPSISCVGLIGYANRSPSTKIFIFKNLGMVGGSITGGPAYVGTLAGGAVGSAAVIENCYNTGTVTGGTLAEGSAGIGGLAGVTGLIVHSYNTGAVTGGDEYTGGLAGISHQIVNSYNTGTVYGEGYVGGLTGGLGAPGKIDSSFNGGTVSCGAICGGLVGRSHADINDSYNAGSVSARTNGGTGGLVGNVFLAYGTMGPATTISNSYSIGSVTVSPIFGPDYTYTAGGLIGGFADGSVLNCYSTGDVSPYPGPGGFMGSLGAYQTFTNNWWFNAVNPKVIAGSIPATPPTITKAAGASDFKDSSHAVYNDPSTPWNFTSIWTTQPNKYPCHKWWVADGGSCPS